MAMKAPVYRQSDCMSAEFEIKSGPWAWLMLNEHTETPAAMHRCFRLAANNGPGRGRTKRKKQIAMRQIPQRRAGSCPPPFNRVAGILTGIAFLPLLQSPVLAGQSINLMWQPSPDANVVGYAVYEGTNSGAYTSRIDARNTTSVTVSNLASGVNYYFVATAYDSSGLESLPSNEIVQSVKVPVNTAPFISAIANQTITVG